MSRSKAGEFAFPNRNDFTHRGHWLISRSFSHARFEVFRSTLRTHRDRGSSHQFRFSQGSTGKFTWGVLILGASSSRTGKSGKLGTGQSGAAERHLSSRSANWFKGIFWSSARRGGLVMMPPLLPQNSSQSCGEGQSEKSLLVMAEVSSEAARGYRCLSCMVIPSMPEPVCRCNSSCSKIPPSPVALICGLARMNSTLSNARA